MLVKRLERLEASRPRPGAVPPLDLVGLAPDVLARVMQAKARGTFPRSLCDSDLEALVALSDQQGAI